MNAILDILLRGMDIIERLRTSSALTDIQMIIFGVLLVFGVINCILGYRLLRFWMMLFGFAIGAGLGYGAAFLMGIWDTTMQLAVSAGVGVVLAIIVFISYKAGIFVMGAGLGLGIAVYVLHPTTSLMFFVCLLAGVGIGSLAIKWAREVIITGTSLLGGAMAGMALAKLGGLAEFPYGIGLSAAFAALGMLIQFATNKKKYIDEYEEEEEYVKPVKNKVKKSVEKEYADDFVYREPLRKTEPRPRGNSFRRERPVDIQVGGEHTRRGEYYGLDSDKTIIYRPRKKSEPEFDLPLDSYAYDDSYGRRPYPKNSSKKKTYTVRVENPDFSGREEWRGSRNDHSSDSHRKNSFYADLYDEDFRDNEEFYDDADLYDELDPIDEDELDEEIIREMMEEEDRESILPWKKHGEKNFRKEGRNGKRG